LIGAERRQPLVGAPLRLCADQAAEVTAVVRDEAIGEIGQGRREGRERCQSCAQALALAEIREQLRPTRGLDADRLDDARDVTIQRPDDGPTAEATVRVVEQDEPAMIPAVSQRARPRRMQRSRP
jgi:hypothetical protein